MQKEEEQLSVLGGTGRTELSPMCEFEVQCGTQVEMSDKQLEIRVSCVDSCLRLTAGTGSILGFLLENGGLGLYLLVLSTVTAF